MTNILKKHAKKIIFKKANIKNEKNLVKKEKLVKKMNSD